MRKIITDLWTKIDWAMMSMWLMGLLILSIAGFGMAYGEDQFEPPKWNLSKQD